MLEKKENVAIGLSILALVGLGGLGWYYYRNTEALEAEIQALNAALVGAGLSMNESQEGALTAAVAKVAPAVVSIVISKDVPKLEVVYENPFGNNPRFRGFDVRIPVYRYEGTKRQEVGAGTGFFVREDGYIVTNNHVIDEVGVEYTALLSSGEQKAAEVIYRDEINDLALLKIDGGGYPTVVLGDSSKLQLGQTVAAIGNALGEYSNSVSVGIISGLNRTVEAYNSSTRRVERLSDVIQTDAAINLGNSGGPLFNLSGEVVGVNVVTTLGANSIAFAVPSMKVADLLRVLN